MSACMPWNKKNCGAYLNSPPCVLLISFLLESKFFIPFMPKIIFLNLTFLSPSNTKPVLFLNSDVNGHRRLKLLSVAHILAQYQRHRENCPGMFLCGCDLPAIKWWNQARCRQYMQVAIYRWSTEQWNGLSIAHLIQLSGRHNSHVISLTVTAWLTL